MNDSLDRIDGVLQTLEEELGVYDDLIQVKARNEATYKSLRAKLYLSSKHQEELKTVAEKDAWVDEQLDSEYFEYRLSEGRLEAHKARLQTLRSLLSGLQTLASQGRI